jgi:AraC-like DNA-binding protein
LAGAPKELIENPKFVNATPISAGPVNAGPVNSGMGSDDVLSDVLRTIRLTAAMQFCFMPAGAWQTDATPAFRSAALSARGTIPFHVVVAGTCWLRIGDRHIDLDEGDIVAFPFGTGHQLGAGRDGRLIIPTRDLPPRPWRHLPILTYGNEPADLRLLCGYLECTALNFQPLRNALPELLHVRTRSAGNAGWLQAAIAQIAAEVDRPRHGGISMLERLSEIAFIEVLRHHILNAQLKQIGWLAALADPNLARCLAMLHADPLRNWSVQDLAGCSGLSRSTLAERFELMLGTSPIRYLRDWRLFLASLALSTSGRAIAEIASEAGYGTEAAFNRAFARCYGTPPAAWRQQMREGTSTR